MVRPTAADPNEEEEDYKADFDERGMSEKPEAEEKEDEIPAPLRKACTHLQTTAQPLPWSPGPSQHKRLSYLKTIGSPAPIRIVQRDGKLQLSESYLARLVKHRSPELRIATRNTRPVVYMISIPSKKASQCEANAEHERSRGQNSDAHGDSIKSADNTSPPSEEGKQMLQSTFKPNLGGSSRGVTQSLPFPPTLLPKLSTMPQPQPKAMAVLNILRGNL